MSIELPLVLDELAHDVDVSTAVERHRLLCFLFPRRVMRRVVGAASRFADLALHPDARHTHDVVFTAFVMKVLRLPGLVRRYVDQAFVDDSDPRVIAFYLVLKEAAPMDTAQLTVTLFVEEAHAVLQANSVALELQPSEAAADDEGGGGRGGGRGGAGGGRGMGGRGAKRRKLASKQSEGLVEAYQLMRRPTIPVYDIASSPPFNTWPLAWGELLACDDDLDGAMTHVLHSRLLDLGHAVEKVTFGRAEAQAHHGDALAGGAGSDDDAAAATADDEESPTAQGGREPVFHYGGGTHTFDRSVIAYLQVTHPLTAKFVRPSIRDDGILPCGQPDLWRLCVPEVDLPKLSLRHLAHTNLYDDFAMYASRLRNQRDALEANPRGDLSLLSSFFSEYPAARGDGNREAAARLVFDVLTRAGGRVPKAVGETMAQMVELLARNNQQLPKGSGVHVKQYRNLTYSGNYVLHLLEQFEQLGTFYFHAEQFITMLVLEGVNFRPRHEDDDDEQSNVGMCANLLNYGRGARPPHPRALLTRVFRRAAGRGQVERLPVFPARLQV
jgi:hypothetical protein